MRNEFSSLGIQIAVYLPDKKLTNQEIAECKPNGKNITSDDIKRKTGVEFRSLAANIDSPLTLAINAYQRLPSHSPNYSEISFSTSYPTGEHLATNFQNQIGGQADSLIDIHYACSGGAVSLGRLSQNSTSLPRLLICSEIYTPTMPDLLKGEIDPAMSQTIFTDGATVALINPTRVIASEPIYHVFPPELAPAICMPVNYNFNQSGSRSYIDIPQPSNQKFTMDGPQVYRTMVNTIPELVLEALDAAKMNPSEIKAVLLHQGSLKMVEGIANRLGILKDRCMLDINEGNLSSASIFKALAKMIANDQINPEDKIAYCGFGAGLSAVAGTLKFS